MNESIHSDPADSTMISDINAWPSHVFNRIDWTAFGTTFVVSLIVYVLTMAPSVTLENCGPLVVAADYLGVPYPPGYPVWTLLAWVFKSVFGFVTYHGHPNPAWGIAFMSAFFSALTCGLTALLISNIARKFMPPPVTTTRSTSTWLICGVGAVSAGLTLACTHTLWSLSVIVETGTLKVFMQTGILVLLYVWMNQPDSNKPFYLAAFLFGAGLTTYYPLTMIAIPIAACILLKDWRLFRDLAFVALPVYGILLLNSAFERLMYKTDPTTGASACSWAHSFVWTNGPETAGFWMYPVLICIVVIAGRFLLKNGKQVTTATLLFALGLLFWLYLPIASEHNPPMNWGGAKSWQGFIHCVSRGSYEKMTLASVFSVTYLKQLAQYFTDLANQFTLPAVSLGVVGLASLARRNPKWFVITLIAFLTLSCGVIVGLNPRPCLADEAHCRLFFVQSHCIFAMWVGLGAAFLIAQMLKRYRNGSILPAVAAVILLLLPAISILNNFCSTESIERIGGAEQNGHDFGWQFGRYILEGADALTSELKPGDIPLPNPHYPPAMEPNAIYFGGTDAGRFVPTYMVFSAKVRPDIYVLTQNALADRTYTSTMRDLYGDRIWLPADADCNDAFRIFADEARTGRSQGAVDFPSGRVVIQGVQDVMTINGIICRMIHDHNKLTHAFYVEESYVISWMYPYMEPHGLIMKLNPEPLAKIPDQVVKDDTAFWAWYEDKLLTDRKFLRDPAARQIFSKLRCGIVAAGTQKHPPWGT